MSQFNSDTDLTFKDLKKFLEEKNYKEVSLNIYELLKKKILKFK